jgi:toxin ParE1/3/4
MIRKRPAAVEAVIEQALYFGSDNPSMAIRLMDAVEKTLKDIEVAPRIGRPYPSDNPELAQLRVLSVDGFRNHLIFYEEAGADIIFVHLLHAARDIGPALGD